MVLKYASIYKEMTSDQLDDEFDALSDQILGFLLASECLSIEVMYDDTNLLKCEFTEFRDSSYREQMN